MSAPDKTQLLVIEPGRQRFSTIVKELIAYRELFYFLVLRDITVRYKQTVFGVLWMVFQPLAATLMFTVIFNRVAKIPSDGIPYPLFVLSGLVPWMFFASALQRASESLVGSGELIKKIYFPRIIVPISAASAGVVDFAVALVTLFLVMIYYRFSPGPALLFLPFLIFLVLWFAVSVASFFSALNVRFRDARYILGYLTTLWMYATPVIYPYSMISEKMRMLAMLNPMVGIVQGFKWSLIGGPFPAMELTAAGIITVVLFVFGQLYFRSVERTFADVI